ncbi:hypothetical protein GCM10010244_35490 [Streptomyces coeruleorubidus]|nr:hypothetical protein GCM10010244_35490 [Streptomyces bellus]
MGGFFLFGTACLILTRWARSVPEDGLCRGRASFRGTAYLRDNADGQRLTSSDGWGPSQQVRGTPARGRALRRVASG